MTAMIVRDLKKTFRVRAGHESGLRRLFSASRTREVTAVQSVSFAIERGERVAFIGHNGAGKSTTLKMLTGILHPTSGHAEVAGLVPWLQRRQLARQIGIVFGQRSQFWFHLPVRDSFNLLRRIYSVELDAYQNRVKRLATTFDIHDLLDRPVSQLSLGQRIRCEIVAALLHAPAILLLDEPTIGLDVTAKAALRDHLNALSEEEGTTVLLTSHDTGDIEKICERVIVIDEGQLLLDEPLEQLREQFLQKRSIVLLTAEEQPQLAIPGATIISAESYRLTLSVDTRITTVEQVVAAAFRQLGVRDLIIENPPLEEIVKAIYRGDASRVRGHAAH